jgi:Nif-specific regulatory protein
MSLLAGRYTLEALLAEGGEGRVYRATDHWRHTTVAVKLLRDDPERAGIQAWADLDHVNIVRVLDAFLSAKSRYLALEYVAGPTLREAYLTWGEGCLRKLLDGVCRGLQAAHGRGLLHGDIKPSNILLDGCRSPPSRAVLTDFGFCRPQPTEGAGFRGTAAFAPPELVRGDRPDRRADLYSLGATLFEVLTGQPVFTRDSVQAVLDAHLHEQPRDPREINDRVSPAMARLVLRLLSKEPGERPRSAEALLGARERRRPGISLPALPATFEERPWRFIRRAMELAGHGRGTQMLVYGHNGARAEDLLARLSIELGLAGVDRVTVGGPDACSHADLIHELVRRTQALTQPDAPAGDNVPPAMGARIRCLAEAARLASGQPLSLLIDPGRSDIDSLGVFLDAAGPLLAGEQVMMTVAVDKENLRRLQAAISGVCARPHVRTVRLRRLTRGETARLVCSCLGIEACGSEIAAVVHAASGGDPTVVPHILGHLITLGSLRRSGGQWIAESIPDLQSPEAWTSWGVLGPMPALHRRVLTAIAALGERHADDVLGEVAAASASELDEAVRALVEGAHVVRRGGGWALRYPALRDCLLASLDASERTQLHARAARAILARRPDDSEWVAPLVWHLAESGAFPEALGLGLPAAEKSLQTREYQTALSLFRMVERCVPPDDGPMGIRVARGTAVCHAALGQWRQTATQAARALAIGDAEALPIAQRAELTLMLAKADSAVGTERDAERRLGELLEIPLPPPVRAEVMSAAAHVAAEGRRWVDAERHARAGLETGAADPSLRSSLENTLGVALLMQGRLEEARVPLEGSYHARESEGQELDAGRCALNLGILTRRAGSYAEARQWLRLALDRLGAAGAVSFLSQVHNTLGLLELTIGDPWAACASFARAVRLALESGRWRTACRALNNHGLAMNACGERAQARALFMEARVRARHRGDRSAERKALRNLANVWLDCGEAAQAEHCLSQVTALGPGSDDPEGSVVEMLCLARLKREQGLLDQAGTHMDDALRMVDEAGDAQLRLRTYCELAVLRIAQGRGEDAVRAAERAASSPGYQGTVDEVIVLRTLGQALASAGRHQDAASVLQRCLALAGDRPDAEETALVRLAVGRWLADGHQAGGFRAPERYLAQAADAFRRLGSALRLRDAEEALERLSSGATGGAAVATTRKLSALYRMLTLVNSAESAEGLLDQVLDLAVHAVGGERGLIILVDPASKDLVVRAKTEIDGATVADASRISEAVVRQVAGAGVPVFSDDALKDARFSDHDSIRLNRIACFACVPLTVRGVITGTIYVDSSDLSRRLVEDDISFLVAFANHAAIAMENRRLLAELEDENAQLHERLEASESIETLVGHSPGMMAVARAVRAVARSSVTVLIQGETGTGKELIAKAIHHLSPRRRGRFVTVNCSALPEGLLESELFGHARGAFTGATGETEGLFVAATGGTIFLDEIADMSLSLQAKLLRVLDSGEVRPVGRAAARQTDARVLCATNRDLHQAMEQGRFRPDLYYRIKVVVVRLPALRERRQDIPLLVSHFVSVYNERFGAQIRRVDRQAMAMLCARDWRGNVRELEHVVEAAVALSPGTVVDPDALTLVLDAPLSSRDGRLVGPLAEELRAAERQCLDRALKESGWNVSAAARRLAIGRRQIQRLMRRHDLGPAPPGPRRPGGNTEEARS